jgi:hypothetical protein
MEENNSVLMRRDYPSKNALLSTHLNIFAAYEIVHPGFKPEKIFI